MDLDDDDGLDMSLDDSWGGQGQHGVGGGKKEEGGGREVMLVPAVCTSHLSRCLLGINSIVQVSTLSIDTMQHAPQVEEEEDSGGNEAGGAITDLLDEGDEGRESRFVLSSLLTFDPSPSTSDKPEVNLPTSTPTPTPTSTSTSTSTPTRQLTLATVVSSIIHQLMLAKLHGVYIGLLRRIKNTRPLLPSDVTEDAALQVIFDLVVCESMATQLMRLYSLHSLSPSPSPSPSYAYGLTVSKPVFTPEGTSIALLEKVVTAWQNYLDPITAELLMPLVIDNASSFLSATALLLPSMGWQEPTAVVIGTGGGNRLPFNAMDHATHPKSDMPLLSAIFPSSMSTSAQTGSVPTVRFGLLPLAVSTTVPPSATYLQQSRTHNRSVADKGGKERDLNNKSVGSSTGTMKAPTTGGIKWW